MPTTDTRQDDLDAVLHYSERKGLKPAENNSLKRAMNILFRPAATWPVIADEEGGIMEALFPYLVAMGFVPNLIGSVMNTALWGTYRALVTGAQSVPSIGSTLFGSAIHFAYAMAGIVVAAKIVELIAPVFGLRKSWVLSTRAIVYGSTPAYIGALIYWIPVLGWLAGLVSTVWSLLLTFQGLKALLAKPAEPAKI